MTPLRRGQRRIQHRRAHHSLSGSHTGRYRSLPRIGCDGHLIDGIGNAVKLCGIDSDFVGALPTALMKPLSGSGARGLMVDAMTTYGPDSFVGRLSCIFQGSTGHRPFIFWRYISAA